MRLIDADALKQRLLKTYKAEELLNGLVHQSEDKARVSQALSSLGEAILAIDDAQTIDAVPVFVSWLREIAINNAETNKTVTFVKAVEDICNRAETGLRQYLEDCL